jgi:hypothetical protein
MKSLFYILVACIAGGMVWFYSTYMWEPILLTMG